MHLPTIFTALLLPLAAVAQEVTTTSTSTVTITKTLTLQRAVVTVPSNTTSFHPTAPSAPSTTLTQPSATGAGASISPTPNAAGPALGGAAHVAAVAVAGVIAAALL
ncbi:94cb5014-1beb-48f4-ab64-7a4cd3df3472 [Thermothielavioides terrestris]|uniref:94cb5014-1beb-48f4-ab64-7a4cd3df3472 n=1 Tax=Thermothielavioides terrestris TaxID=2587410 RepID=A0A446BBP9_9PEZI|nr:94cb5014-1beb-48f4-ab64-7a4cd3df3472 [Thermothielavioides terrestris]